MVVDIEMDFGARFASDPFLPPHARHAMTHDTSPPLNWPADVTFLDKQRYATRFPNALKSRIQSKSTVPRLPKCRLVRIQVISDPGHPAKGQRGLFASQKILPLTHIIDYLGEVHYDERLESDYDLSLLRLTSSESVALGMEDSDISVGVDAQCMGNEARFINDYRGTGVAKPNAELKDRIVDGEMRMSVWSLNKPIQRGDEILVSYGKSWWKARADEGVNGGP